MEDAVSDQIIAQRVRNRIIEWLEWACDFESSPSPGIVALVNFGFDFLQDDFKPADYLPPTYTEEETQILSKVHQALCWFCEATPANLDDHTPFQELPAWQLLLLFTREALAIFNKRGRLPED